MNSQYRANLERIERIIPLLSHIAQIGLFALTAWGLFHTVIPLYQKAAVDEQVARQQTELRQLTIKLDTSYAKNRRQTVLQFSFVAGPTCTGLLQPVSFDPSGKSQHKSPLDIDIHACLNQELEDFKPKAELRDVDRAALTAEVDKIGLQLDEKRSAAKLEADRLTPADSSKGPVAMGALAQLTLEEMKQLGASPQQLTDAENKMSLQYQRGVVESRYTTVVGQEISDLANLSWPKRRDPDSTRDEP